MAADAEVALLEEGLGQQRQADRERRGQHGERRARRIEPGDADRGQDELEGGAQELSAQVGQEPQRVDGVAALGHVRGESALEVAIAEAGDLREERQAQTRLEVSSEAQQARRDGELEEEQRGDEAEQHPDGAQALSGEPQLAAEVEEAAEEQGLDDEAPGGEEQRRHQGHRGQEAVGPQESEQVTPRPARRLLQSRGQLRREGSRSPRGLRHHAGHRRRCRAAAAHPHQHGPAEQELVLVSRSGRGRPHHPVVGRDALALARWLIPGALDAALEHPRRLPTAPETTGAHDGGDHPGGGIEGRQRAPARVQQGGLDQTGHRATGEPHLRQAPAQRAEELLRARPLAPGGRWERHGVDVELVEKALAGGPAPSGAPDPSPGRRGRGGARRPRSGSPRWAAGRPRSPAGPAPRAGAGGPPAASPARPRGRAARPPPPACRWRCRRRRSGRPRAGVRSSRRCQSPRAGI